MILGRLFETLFERGRRRRRHLEPAARRLYKDGLQRERFLPFIELLKERLDMLELDGGRDYRLARLARQPVYHTPLDGGADSALDEAFAAPDRRRAGRARDAGRAGPRSSCRARRAGVAWFTFDELCARPLGAADYLAIAEHFHTVILAGIPALGRDSRNEARRFITLIDTLYEAHANLIASAAAPPDELYPAGDGAFEFQRTVSRLMEMQSGRLHRGSATSAGRMGQIPAILGSHERQPALAQAVVSR